MTDKILQNVVFPDRYVDIRRWGIGHHEFLDGSGYPHGLKGDEICVETRLLTILDIFEALTAQDRPYKEAKSPDVALDILYKMADEGKLDRNVLDLFKNSDIWKTKLSEKNVNILNFQTALLEVIRE